jgi:N6-adenosine-specific RNA methylase IME4
MEVFNCGVGDFPYEMPECSNPDYDTLPSYLYELFPIIKLFRRNKKTKKREGVFGLWVSEKMSRRGEEIMKKLGLKELKRVIWIKLTKDGRGIKMIPAGLLMNGYEVCIIGCTDGIYSKLNRCKFINIIVSEY